MKQELLEALIKARDIAYELRMKDTEGFNIEKLYQELELQVVELDNSNFCIKPKLKSNI